MKHEHVEIGVSAPGIITDLDDLVQRTCGARLAQLATTAELGRFDEAKEALGGIGHGHDLSDEHIRTCDRCRYEVLLGYSR